MRRPAGFTLIEVLVALAIVAITLGGSLALVAGAARNAELLEARTVAGWVLENALVEAELQAASLQEGTVRYRETQLGREYEVTLAVARDPLRPLLEIDVEVLVSGSREALAGGHFALAYAR